MILGRNEHVQLVGRNQSIGPFFNDFAWHRWLHECRPVRGRDQAPGGTIGIIRRKCEQSIAPIGFNGEGNSRSGSMQSDCSNLDQEGMPGVALMRAQRGKVTYFIPLQRSQQPGQGE
jgi:hypothetical protein